MIDRGMDEVKIIECPRDAWQGLAKIIPTEAKAAYLGKLIEFGFRHLDAVSFVAPQYVPQMADSELVMKSLALVGAGLLVAETRESKAGTENRGRANLGSLLTILLPNNFSDTGIRHPPNFR